MIYKKVPIALVGLILQLYAVPTTHTNYYGLIIFVASVKRFYIQACFLHRHDRFFKMTLCN